MDLGLVNPSNHDRHEASLCASVGSISVSFTTRITALLSVADIIVKSSNRGTGRLALQIGAKRQKEFMKADGFYGLRPRLRSLRPKAASRLYARALDRFERGDDFLWPRHVEFADCIWPRAMLRWQMAALCQADNLSNARELRKVHV